MSDPAHKNDEPADRMRRTFDLIAKAIRGGAVLAVVPRAVKLPSGTVAPDLEKIGEMTLRLASSEPDHVCHACAALIATVRLSASQHGPAMAQRVEAMAIVLEKNYRDGLVAGKSSLEQAKPARRTMGHPKPKHPSAAKQAKRAH